MPNWCENNLYVSGPREELQKFLELSCADKSKGETIQFQRIYPMPDDPEEQLKQSGDNPLYSVIREKKTESLLREAWYYWHLNHWGTKWDLDGDCMFTDKEKELVWSFWTAWSPPEGVIKKASENFPELVFRLEYWEYGNDFAGFIVYQNGQAEETKEGEPKDFEFSQPPDEWNEDKTNESKAITEEQLS